VDVGAQAPDVVGPTDLEWPKSFPIHAEPAVPGRFDRAALEWRSSQNFLDELPAPLRPTNEEEGRSMTATETAMWFPLRLAAVRNTPPPETWVPCEKCGGSGGSEAWSAACPLCDGDGFLLPIVGSGPTARPKVCLPAKD
jgi:hypothetical protein